MAEKEQVEKREGRSQTTLPLLSDYGARLLPFHEDAVRHAVPDTTTGMAWPLRGGPTQPCGILSQATIDLILVFVSLSMGHRLLDRSDPSTLVDRSEILTRP